MKVLVCFPVLLVAAAPALAQTIVSTAPQGETESITVNFADLNINTEDGWARLDGRLRAAARTVCDVRTGMEPLAHETATNRCFRSALAKGRETGREMLAARQSGTVLAAASVIAIAKP